MKTYLYLARHGQTDWNRQQRLQGWVDTPLNRRGLYQARRLANRLRTKTIDNIYTSALIRTQQTAAFFPEQIPRTSHLGLNERRYGIFTGAALGDNDTALRKSYLERRLDIDDSLDGGESLQDFHQRASDALRDIVADNIGKTLLVVGHGGTNGQLIRALQGIAPDEGKPTRPSNSTVYYVEIPSGWLEKKRSAEVWLYLSEHRRERVVIRRIRPS